MHAQTPVQIAWITKDLDATEKALTTLLGAKKWIQKEVDAVTAASTTTEVVQRGVMPGGMEFAYVTAEPAGVP